MKQALSFIVVLLSLSSFAATQVSKQYVDKQDESVLEQSKVFTENSVGTLENFTTGIVSRVDDMAKQAYSNANDAVAKSSQAALDAQVAINFSETALRTNYVGSIEAFDITLSVVDYDSAGVGTRFNAYTLLSHDEQVYSVYQRFFKTESWDDDCATGFLRKIGAHGRRGIIFGENISVEGNDSLAFGTFAAVTGTASFAMGRRAMVVGDFSFAAGSESLVNGSYSHALGRRTVVNGSRSSAYGESCEVDANNSMAAGYNALTTNAYSYTWSGVDSYEPYGSHGQGSYNINPSRGLRGFYVGNSNMEEIVSTAVGRVKSGVTTNDVCNIVTNDVEEFTEWALSGESYDATKTYTIEFNEGKYPELADLWVLTVEGMDVKFVQDSGLKKDETSLHEGWISSTDWETVLYIDADRQKVRRNALGLVHKDTPTPQVKFAGSGSTNYVLIVEDGKLNLYAETPDEN